MAKTVLVTEETIADTGIRPLGERKFYTCALHMDRRRLARELRRVVRIQRRELAKRHHREPEPNGTSRKLNGFHLTDWWVMIRRTCLYYGVRA